MKRHLIHIAFALLLVIATGCSSGDSPVSAENAEVAKDAQVIDGSQSDKQKATVREGGNASSSPGAGRTGGASPPPL
jgi:hypothetical protein